MVLINIFFIYWMGSSFTFKLVKSKNYQIGKLPWQVVAHTGKHCLAQRFRDLMIDTNPGLTILAWGFAKLEMKPLSCRPRAFAPQPGERGQGGRPSPHEVAGILIYAVGVMIMR